MSKVIFHGFVSSFPQKVQIPRPRQAHCNGLGEATTSHFSQTPSRFKDDVLKLCSTLPKAETGLDSNSMGVFFQHSLVLLEPQGCPLASGVTFEADMGKFLSMALSLPQAHECLSSWMTSGKPPDSSRKVVLARIFVTVTAAA